MSPRRRPTMRGLRGCHPAPAHRRRAAALQQHWPASAPLRAGGSAVHCPGARDARGVAGLAGGAGGTSGGGSTGAEVLVAVPVSMLVVVVAVAVVLSAARPRGPSPWSPRPGVGAVMGSASLHPQVWKPGPSTTAGGRGGSCEPRHSWTWGTPMGVWWVDPGLTPGTHQSRSITPPPQLDRGEKI